MTDATNALVSDAERTVIEHSRRLANTLAVNQHKTYIPPLLEPWFIHAPPRIREALRDSFKQGQATQRVVSAVLAQVKPIEQFAEPLLKTALAARGWGDVNPRTYGLKQVRLLSNLTLFFARQQVKLVDTFAQLTMPDLLTPESLELNLVSGITQHSLLQAALQNFEIEETASDGFDSGSCIYEVSARRAIEHPALKPEHFALICRDLDLGFQYQWHLARVFEPVDDNLSAEDINSKAYKLKFAFTQNLRHEFTCALHMAYMKKEITTNIHAFMMTLLGAPTALFSLLQSAHGTLQIMGFEVPGVIVFWPESKSTAQAQSCVLYLPNSPHKAFHEFESFELLKATLREWLKGRVFANYFVKLVPLRHRAEFMRRTDMQNVTWDSLLLRSPPIINEPALMSESRHVPQTDDPFVVAWRLQLAQIKDDARLLVVPTEDEDSKSRLERQASFLNIGLSLLTIALGFVPVLGDILLVTSVIQLGVELYDGIKAWEQGDRAAALEHLFDIAQNFALVASSAGAAKVLRPEPVVDALVAVRSVTGRQRLWRPDLEPYAVKNGLLAGLKPDAHGLYSVGEKQYLQFEQQIFRVEVSPDSRQGVIRHPTDPQAYRPRIEHNGSGAWVHELETPRKWSRMQLFRRLGPEVRGFSDATAEQVLLATDTREAVLRKLYMDNRPMPPALADSIKRVRLSEMIESFIAQMKQGVNSSPDNGPLQLELLTRLPGWPADRVLRVVDMQGVTIREYGSDMAPSNPRLQVVETQVSRGDLLKVTLDFFSTQQIEALLGRLDLGLEQQVQALSRKLGQYAESTRQELFSRLYDIGEVAPTQTHSLKDQFPGLPVVVLEELISHLSPEELIALNSGGRLPLHVLEEARSYAQVMRLNRSIEGLYFEALRSADSSALGWRTLLDLPGWPANLRLVVRDKSNGTVLNTLGRDTAIYSQELFKTGDVYEFHGTVDQDIYRSPDLLMCVAQGLTPSQRTALSLPATDPGVVLKRKVANLAAINRGRSAGILGMQRIKPWFRSPLRMASGRLGYTLGGRSGHLLEEDRAVLLQDLVADLFPLMNEGQAGQFLYRLKLTPELTIRALNKLKAELQTLRSGLDHWVAATVWTQTSAAGPRVLVPPHIKRDISQALISTWRRQSESVQFADHSGYALDLNGWPVDCLPELSADFGHVSSLRLHNSPNGRFPVQFLERFPNLRVLSIVSSQLTEVPSAVLLMPELIDLNLQGNQIVLSDRTSTLLSGLTRLKSLNLMANPLGRRISVRRMTDLVHLRLRYTGLQTWPEGVEALSHLETLDLRDNDITRIPQDVFDAQRTSVNRVTHLHDNPLSADSLRRLDNYRREMGIDFGITPRRQHIAQAGGVLNWSVQPSYEQHRVWRNLSGIGPSADFFRVLEDLTASAQYLHHRENLSRRVWAMLNDMHSHSELRDQLFEVSANPNTCADGIPMIFADMELRQQIFTALNTGNTEGKLLNLAHGLFRLELLDKHVLGVIEGRVAEVHAEQRAYVQQLQGLIDAVSPDFVSGPLSAMTAQEQQGVAYRLGTGAALRLAQRLSPADLQARIDRIEPLEVQMFYQVKLARDLGLPARPKRMIFERMANVTPQQLEVAKQLVLSEDTPAAKTAFIEKQGFWGAFLEKKYPDEFSAADSPLHARMQVIYIAREGMSSQDYVSKTHAVGESRQQVRDALIARLTKKELEEHPFTEPKISTSSDV